MMLVEGRALVVQTRPFRERGRWVRCYTEHHGMINGIVSTVRGKSGGGAALWEPLQGLGLSWKPGKNNGLASFVQAEPLWLFPSGPEAAVVHALRFFLAEVWAQAIREEEPNEPLFAFLWHRAEELALGKPHADVHVYHLLDLCRFLGFAPQPPRESKEQWFNLREGVFQERQPPGSDSLGLQESHLLAHLMEASQEPERPKLLSSEGRYKILDVLMRYLVIHQPGFMPPKSLSVLAQVFS